MIRNDYWILRQDTNLITPFVAEHVREMELATLDSTADVRRIPVLSYGLSSYGYDLRLSPKDFKIFKKHKHANEIDPKRFESQFLEEGILNYSPNGNYFIMPANSYALGFSVERVTIPRDTTGICLGKSTYARCGVATNITPIDAGFKGHITLEFANLSPNPVRLYANEGCCQLILFGGLACKTSYADRQGKYQNQEEKVVNARI